MSSDFSSSIPLAAPSTCAGLNAERRLVNFVESISPLSFSHAKTRLHGVGHLLCVSTQSPSFLVSGQSEDVFKGFNP